MPKATPDWYPLARKLRTYKSGRTTLTRSYSEIQAELLALGIVANKGSIWNACNPGLMNAPKEFKRSRKKIEKVDWDKQEQYESGLQSKEISRGTVKR